MDGLSEASHSLGAAYASPALSKPTARPVNFLMALFITMAFDHSSLR
jgi:hypothetical protein